jgi:hypothetical protein
MDAAAAVLFFGGLALLVAAWPRLTSKAKLTRRVYRHVDETIGARKFENDRRATLNRRWRLLVGPKWAGLLYPHTQLSGAAVLPGTRRVRRYVTITWTDPPPWFREVRLPGLAVPVLWPTPWRVWHIAAVTLRWTSEAGANSPNFVEWLERGRPTQGGGLAQALGLQWSSSLFDHTADYRHSAITFTRTRTERVAERIAAADDLGEFADDA